MNMVSIYHPVLDRTESVPELSLEHHFRGGWILASDHLKSLEDENEQKSDEKEKEKPNDDEKKSSTVRASKRTTEKDS